ncbi:MAG: DUF4292 domain-containing protein [Ignavibacteria bacterium]|jgi:hypothetical protein|nr:DUF4292 domain-containing protein [Ignavibacteria bacterium]
MKIFSVLFLLCFLLYCSVFSQEEDSSFSSPDTISANYDTLRTTDSLIVKDSLNIAFLNNPVRIRIAELIKTVNETSAYIDLLHSENVVKIKTPSLEATGEIEIKMKRNDDIWFRISGGFAFVSKDAFIAHFNRDKFIYFDNLENKVIEGPTNEVNIGIIARMKCSFDDLMNVMSGACTIIYSDKDTLSMTEDQSNIIITVKGRKILKYWIDKELNCVNKYAYINNNFKEYLRIIYSNFSKVGNGYYAKRVEITRPFKNEYLKVANEKFTLNNPALQFKVDFPFDAKRVVWDN